MCPPGVFFLDLRVCTGRPFPLFAHESAYCAHLSLVTQPPVIHQSLLEFILWVHMTAHVSWPHGPPMRGHANIYVTHLLVLDIRGVFHLLLLRTVLEQDCNPCTDA